MHKRVRINSHACRFAFPRSVCAGLWCWRSDDRAWACPGCKDALAANETGAIWSRGYLLEHPVHDVDAVRPGRHFLRLDVRRAFAEPGPERPPSSASSPAQPAGTRVRARGNVAERRRSLAWILKRSLDPGSTPSVLVVLRRDCWLVSFLHPASGPKTGRSPATDCGHSGRTKNGNSRQKAARLPEQRVGRSHAPASRARSR